MSRLLLRLVVVVFVFVHLALHTALYISSPRGKCYESLVRNSKNHNTHSLPLKPIDWLVGSSADKFNYTSVFRNPLLAVCGLELELELEDTVDGRARDEELLHELLVLQYDLTEQVSSKSKSKSKLSLIRIPATAVPF